MNLFIELLAVTALLNLSEASTTKHVNNEKIFIGTDKYDVIMLSGGITRHHRNPTAKHIVDVYCYPGAVKSFIHLFHTVKLHIRIDNDDFRQYTGGSPADVYSQYAAESYGWSINPFKSRQPKSLPLDPFNCTCLAINTKERHDVELQVIGVDLWRVLVMAVGLFLFFSSRTLSGNPVFFYLCGVVVGVCASFMVLVYYVSKLCPKKALTYGVMIGGWTVGAFIFQQVWANISSLLLSYQAHVFWYTVAVGLVSFMACYRIGPPRDERSKNLVMWVLQGIGLLLVFFSSDYQEATAAIVIVSLIIQYFPERFRRGFMGYWLRKFPPKRRLLTSEEYYEQGARETKQALDGLRQYCSSPDCAQWKIMLKLNESRRSENASPQSRSVWTPPSSRIGNASPQSRSVWTPPSSGFASFVEGQSHLSDDEVMDYESYAFSNMSQQNISSDESSVSSEEDDDISNASTYFGKRRRLANAVRLES